MHPFRLRNLVLPITAVANIVPSPTLLQYMSIILNMNKRIRNCVRSSIIKMNKYVRVCTFLYLYKQVTSVYFLFLFFLHGVNNLR